MVQILKNISNRLNQEKDEQGTCTTFDLLTELLQSTQTTGVLFAHTQHTPPWGFVFEAQQNWGFHLVTEGDCFLWLEGEDRAHHLQTGDLVVVGSKHYLAHQPHSPCIPFTQDLVLAPRPSAPAKQTGLICGAYRFACSNPHPIFSCLPPLIHLSQEMLPASVTSLLQLVEAEMLTSQPGNHTLTNHLMDALFVYILRTWLENQTNEHHGWLGALRHPSLTQAIALLHKQPEKAWTLEKISRAVGMSRASFARHFAEDVGVPPMQYLNQHRMKIAYQLLHTTPLSLDEIATRVGYATGFSLSKAFKQQFGLSPRHIHASPNDAPL
ncbi:MAG: AraC family transcriptional regulator [Myxococcales bacterium]|nr:AraC family transcriptional regulator [Myxococcales bacterium]MCB9644916.1 AraC family transcriptional regulator [Myxococcales bacterium]